VLIPWGTPRSSGGPAWKSDGSNTAADQAQQVGMHHDGMHYFPLGKGPGGNRRGLLVVNHEYIDPIALYSLADAYTAAPLTKAQVDKALAAHGVTIIEIALVNGSWTQVDSRYNRRITGATPMAFSGPVGLDHPELQSNNAPMGTLNNCAMGYTPWGTYLACEENWNGYFGTSDTSWKPTPSQQRYGISAAGFGYRWHEGDPRFDLAVNPKELNRFGWVVEIDPFDPGSTPVKRTALGRIKHEGATFTEARSHAVVYTGDDENRDYVYKWVSARPWRQMRARGVSPLDEGTLYVARFDDDGSGTWLPLVHGSGALTPAKGFADQADVLLRTREAADAVGATKLDRPEWITVHPRTKEVYMTLTNGSAGPNAVNPRNPNPYGHIIRWREDRADNTATRFSWDIFVLAGDPDYDPQVSINGDKFGSPDGIWLDGDGRLWIETDISNSAQNRPDRQHDGLGNNAMLCADPETGEIRRFLVGPRGCEITGVITTPDGETMFANVQHPGESTSFWNSQFGAPSASNPRTVSNWPDFDPQGRPRSATLVIRKIGGGKIGT
jgi:secreted PhoX family phosphatase